MTCGRQARKLSRAASPHLHPPRRATPSHEEASLHLPYARPQAANQHNHTHLDAPATRHPHPARSPWWAVRRVWVGVGEHSPLKEQKGADCPKASSTFQGCPLMWARRNKSRPSAIACGSLSRGNNPPFTILYLPLSLFPVGRTQYRHHSTERKLPHDWTR